MSRSELPPFPERMDPIRAWARSGRNHTALVERRTGRRWCYDDLDVLADRLATWLMAQGVRRGDLVATLLGNRPEHIGLLFAAGRVGAALVPLNWRLAAPELRPILRHARPALLVTESDFEALARGAADGDLRIAIRPLDEASPAPTSPEHDGEIAHRPEDPAVVLYTSGSTGKPKGAVLPHRQLHANAVATCRAWKLTGDDVAPITTPLFHTGGWNVFATPIWHAGGTVVLLDGFDADDYLAALDEERCTVALAVPTQLHMLTASALWGRVPASLRYIVSGGAPCPAPLARTVREAGYRLREGYGLTECGPNCFTQSVDESAAHPGWVGRPIDFLEVELASRDGRFVNGAGEGELVLRGPQVFAGYLRDPEPTRAAFRDGWLRTGDVAERSSDGRYRICGRIKEMFISGGENVYPGEVEAALLEHPAVAEVAVTAVPDEKWGEVGRAWVVLSGEQELQTGDLRRFARARLAPFKVPKSVRVVHALPKLGSGKVDRSALVAHDD